MSNQTIEPLELLREYMVELEEAKAEGRDPNDVGKKIIYDEKSKLLTFHQFDGIGQGAIIRLPLNTPTAWKIKGKDGEFYNLGSLWLYLSNKSLPPSQYMRKADELNLSKVSISE